MKSDWILGQPQARCSTMYTLQDLGRLCSPLKQLGQHQICETLAALGSTSAAARQVKQDLQLPGVPPAP